MDRMGSQLKQSSINWRCGSIWHYWESQGIV